METPSMQVEHECIDDGKLEAIGRLYHAYFTGLILTLVARRPAGDAARWMEALFRHQHHQKFLPSFEKLGLDDLPHAQAAAAYHYLSNRIGGVDVEYMAESEHKAWVRFVPPRWVYAGAAICGVPSDVSRAMLRGWYQMNGVSLGNPRLGFVCTAQTVDGQHGLAGYFKEYDQDLSWDERLQFRPGEMAPPFDPAAAPTLDARVWPAERLAKARRNYAIEYIRSGLPQMAQLFGPVDAAYLGRITGRQIGAQFYQDTVARLGLDRAERNAIGFARLMAALAEGEGDQAVIEGDAARARVTRTGWRLARGWGCQPQELFEAWNGLFEGAIAVHDRALRLSVEAREDLGDGATVWTIRG